MASWIDYKKQAQERGALALELFVVMSTPAQSPYELKAQLPAHLAYQERLEQAGALAFAGPLSDLQGEQMQGMGMIVYRAQSLESARALADADPMHVSGAREYTLRRWLVNEGSLTLSVTLAGQTVRL